MPDGQRTEVQEAKRWAVRRLVARVELVAIIPGERIYVDKVQRGPDNMPTFPYVIGNFMGGDDVQGLGTNRQQTHADFQWRVVTEDVPSDEARLAEYYMDNTLQTAEADELNGYVFSCRRVTPIDRPEKDAVLNRSFNNIGGIYRIWISRMP